MTEDEIAAIALALPGASQSAHFGKRDFRVRGKVFLTLPRPGEAVIKLSPDQQALGIATAPDVLAPVPGAWGLKGWTVLRYGACEPAHAADLIQKAWATVAPRSVAAKR
ncbi:MAG: MmcQ/YjbR family DNA-binding protein [Allorhizobium sp.]